MLFRNKREDLIFHISQDDIMVKNELWDELTMDDILVYGLIASSPLDGITLDMIHEKYDFHKRNKNNIDKSIELLLEKDYIEKIQ